MATKKSKPPTRKAGTVRMSQVDLLGHVAAINRSLAVIEFKLDGTVITANGNFLGIFGYALQEIKGKPHSLFVDPTVVDTVDYGQFWERLSRGEYDAGQYKRIGKGNKQVWIQASYNPILDRKGKPLKVVLYATDITAAKCKSADDANQLHAVYSARTVIEYQLDGTVITANENFLKTFGYSLEEIQGKHHSLLVDPSVVDTEEYRQFWERLDHGEFDAGQYKRIGKGGKEIWLQAYYAPIMDIDGKEVKVVTFGTDITAAKLQSADYEGQLKAVSKAQAVIEFNLDGTVITANENFLKTFGYSLEEIQGKHHSLFVDPADVDTEEYRQFWVRLGHGEYNAGQYKRIGKGGKEIWIQASYNPILDMDGKPFKIVKFATDITAQRHDADINAREAEMNAAFRGALDNLLSNVMVADTDLNITYMNNTVRQMMLNAQPDIRKDLPHFDVSRLIGTNIDTFHKNPAHQRGMLSALTKTVTGQFVLGGRTLRVIANPMIDAHGKRLGTVVEWSDRTAELTVEREVQDMVAAIADGRLDQRIPLEGKDGFFQALGTGINQLSDSMGDIVSKVKAAAGEVTLGAEEISQGNTNLSQRTEEQASSLEQTASSMEQMTSSIKQTADNAGQANQLAIAAREQADKGGAVVTRAVKAMTEINDASKKIADIIGVIDEIAFQTNLLALNAAVEAARAGEQGRGFAVVATEVRNLAGRSATAAKEIKGLIQDSVKKVEEGSSLVSQSGQTLDQIVGAFKKVSDIIAEIAAASQEQSAGVEEVNKAVMQLDEMTQQNAALVEQATAASQSMAEQAHGLSDMMAHYRVSEAQTDAANSAASAASAGRTRAAPAAAAPTAAERRAGARPWSKHAAKPGTEKLAPATPPKAKAAVAAHNGTDQEWKQF